MKIYAVEYKGPISDYEWSVVTIWNNKGSAEKEMDRYIFNHREREDPPEFQVKELDTDNECIYDYEE